MSITKYIASLIILFIKIYIMSEI